MYTAHWLEKRAALTPDRIALIGEGERLTFGELRDRSQLLAQGLAEFGVREGAATAFLCRNGLHVPELVHAVSNLGARLMPLNTRLTVHELSYQLTDSGCKHLIYDERHEQLAAELQAVLPDVKIASVAWLRDRSGGGAESAILRTDIEMDAVHTIMYTSGTTGAPKGVLLTYGNHWASAIGSVLNLGLGGDDVWLACVPLFHISGLSIVMRSVIYGMPMMIHERFEPRLVNQAIEEDGVTVVSVVSNMLTRMMDELGERRYPKSFRCMLLGGGPAPMPLLEACVAKGIPVYQTYGMTETASQIVTLPPEFMLSKLGSAGKPLFQSELSIMRDDGEAAPPQAIGEIAVRGPNVTAGYLNRPKATAEAIRGGWLYTGDIGYVDEEGFLYVLDRRNDLIISGGENVYPAEIEAVLIGHPAIAEAGVAGIDDAKWGQVPAAYVRLREGMALSEDEVRDYCSNKLARYKIPARVYFVDQLPRNAANKLLRRELHKLADGGG